MLEALAAGALLGLSAGLAPGPLLALVIAQTVRHGLADGVRVAMAPLLTDVPIVIVSVLAVGAMASAGAPLVLISLAGAVFVAYLAWDTWRAEPPGPPADGAAVPSPRSWTRGAATNALSPHPWLFWLTVGAPTLLATWSAGGPAAALAFLAAFWGCLVGAKAGVAALVARARGRLAGRGYRVTMRVLALLLLVFAAVLLREAWLLAGGGG